MPSSSMLAVPWARTSPGVLRLVVVDDHPVVCDGVVLLLSREPGAEVVGTALDAAQAVEVVTNTRPDVVLLDVCLPGVELPRLVRLLLTAHPEVKIVLFTAHADEETIEDCLVSGVSGCLLKDIGTMELMAGLRDVADGRRVLDPRLNSRPQLALLERLEALSMTRREFEVLRLVAHGMSNPEIAQQMGLARNTVKTYLQTSMNKLGARNRVEAISKARAALLL